MKASRAYANDSVAQLRRRARYSDSYRTARRKLVTIFSRIKMKREISGRLSYARVSSFAPRGFSRISTKPSPPCALASFVSSSETLNPPPCRELARLKTGCASWNLPLCFRITLTGSSREIDANYFGGCLIVYIRHSEPVARELLPYFPVPPCHRGMTPVVCTIFGIIMHFELSRGMHLFIYWYVRAWFFFVNGYVMQSVVQIFT